MQGHLQVILNLAHSPLLQRRLRLIDRLMYCSGIWSYVVGVLTSFVFIAVPFVTIWIGAEPSPRNIPYTDTVQLSGSFSMPAIQLCCNTEIMVFI